MLEDTNSLDGAQALLPIPDFCDTEDLRQQCLFSG